MESRNKKYPISKNKFQCIGPCYYPNTWIIHPITLEYSKRETAFCPINHVNYIDKNTGKYISEITDICNFPTHKEDLSGKEFEINILTPNIDFNDAYFLKIYYNVYSFEDAINFIDTKTYLPLLTKIRVLNCALNAYGSELNIIDNRIVIFFIQVANKLWLNDIYIMGMKYVSINGKEIFFYKPREFTDNNSINSSNLSNETTEQDIKKNFLKSKFVNSDEIYKFIIKYLKHRKDNWSEINNHVQNIKKDFIIFIENKIKISLDII